MPSGTRPFLFAPACGKLAAKPCSKEARQMKKYGAMAALLACASLLAACGREDDGSPTATENVGLNNIAEELTPPPTPGRGRPGARQWRGRRRDRRPAAGRQRRRQRRRGERDVGVRRSAKAGRREVTSTVRRRFRGARKPEPGHSPRSSDRAPSPNRWRRSLLARPSMQGLSACGCRLEPRHGPR